MVCDNRDRDKEEIWADRNLKLASTKGLEEAKEDLINSGL